MTIDVKAYSAPCSASGFQAVKNETDTYTDLLITIETSWLFFPSIMISDVDIVVDNSLMRPHKYPGI